MVGLSSEVIIIPFSVAMTVYPFPLGRMMERVWLDVQLETWKSPVLTISYGSAVFMMVFL